MKLEFDDEIAGLTVFFTVLIILAFVSMNRGCSSQHEETMRHMELTNSVAK